MEKIRIYDVPVRLFHVLFAVLFVTAFVIAQTIDDDSPLFAWHMLAGLTMLFILGLRIIWGIVGSTYARFGSFQLAPGKLISYFKHMFGVKSERYEGHNPASSWAALVMFASTIALGVTGILMSRGRAGDFAEELHEVSAVIFLVTVIGHLGGLLLHHLRHNDRLWMSMVSGWKRFSSDGETTTATEGVSTFQSDSRDSSSVFSADALKTAPGISGSTQTSAPGIQHSYATSGIIFLILTAAWIMYLGNNYQKESSTLVLFGTEVQLGESDDDHGYEYQKREDSGHEGSDERLRDHDDD